MSAAQSPQNAKSPRPAPTASAMAKIAGFMQRMNLECTPANFELIFTVLSGQNDELRDEFGKLGRDLKQVDLDVLIKKYTPHHVEDDIASESIETVGDELNKFMDLVNSESAALEDYDKVLKQQASGLNDPKVSPEKIRSTLTNITAATEKKIAEGEKIRQAVSEQVQRLDDVATELNSFKEQKFIDPLTGLPNRRAFNKHSLSIYQGDRPKPCVIAMVEIDAFGHVKENLGPLIADKFMVHVGKLLSASCSGKDYLARAGDNSFAFIFSDINDGTAKSIATKFTATISRSPLMNATNGQPIGNVTVSTGICGSTNASTTGDIISKTEAVLNVAKSGSGGKVKVFEERRAADTDLERNSWSLYENS